MTAGRATTLVTILLTLALASCAVSVPASVVAAMEVQDVDRGFYTEQTADRSHWWTTFAVVVRRAPTGHGEETADLTIRFRDANGQPGASDQVAIEHLAPGGTSAGAGRIDDATQKTPPTRMDVTIELVEPQPAQIADGEITMGEATSITAGARAGHPSQPTAIIDCPARSTVRNGVTDLFTTVVYRDERGRILGGSQDVSGTAGEPTSLPGRGTYALRFEAPGPTPPGVATAICYPATYRPWRR